MMSIRFHRNFERQYIKLKDKEKKKLKQNIDIFLNDEFNPILNNHSLKWKYMGYRSLNVTGDIRDIYR